MTVGYKPDELSAMYTKRFMYILKKNKKDFALDTEAKIQELVKAGYTQLEATIQHEANMRVLACSEATLFVIVLNNKRIQAQLSQKGIEL